MLLMLLLQARGQEIDKPLPERGTSGCNKERKEPEKLTDAEIADLTAKYPRTERIPCLGLVEDR